MEVRSVRYAQVRSIDISNGEGIGVSLFVQGCPFNPHCKNCFNPDTWDFNGGKEWTQDTEDKLIELANKPYIKRLSILGGEPLADENLDGVLHLVDRFRLSFPNKSIWLYSGYSYSKVMRQLPNLATKKNHDMYKRQMIIKKCNVMVDGKYLDSQRDITLKWRGSSNQRVIDIEKTLQRGKIVFYCN